jgi:hypothetical protein
VGLIHIGGAEVKRMRHQRKRNSTGPASRRSRKGPAEIGAKAKYRNEAARERQRLRQHERSDRGGPQGREDKDFQRKF